MTLGIEAFQAAATAFGLRLETPRVPWWKNVDLAVLEGEVEGVPLLVQQGYWNYNVARVYFHAALAPQLDMGLSISPPAFFLGSQMGENDGYGTVVFDKAFTIKAAEPERVASLMTPQLQSALVTWHNARQWILNDKKTYLNFWISDESVILCLEPEVYKWTFATRTIATEEMFADIRATVALARAISAASERLAPSALLAPHAPAWRAFADAHSLAFSASPLRVHGTFKDVPFTARAAHITDSVFGVEVTASFARQLPFYLRVGPQSRWFETSKRFAAYPDAWTEWASSQSTDDSEFDKLFRVVSADPTAPHAILTDEIRRAMVELQQSHDHVHLTSGGISVRTATMVSPDAFTEILRPLTRLEKLLDGAARR